MMRSQKRVILFLLLVSGCLLHALPSKISWFVRYSADTTPIFLYEPQKKQIFYEDGTNFILAGCPKKIIIPTVDICKEKISSVSSLRVFKRNLSNGLRTR